ASGLEPERGGAARLLQGQDLHLQDPALLEVRGLLPHDRDREGPEVQDARAGDRGAGVGGGGGGSNRLRRRLTWLSTRRSSTCPVTGRRPGSATSCSRR